MAIASQRASCDDVPLWELITNVGGVNFSISTGAAYLGTGASGRIDDGLPHRIVASRFGGRVSVTIDGGGAGTPTDWTQSLPALAPLRIGTGVCDGTRTRPFEGSITNLCVTSP